MLQTVVNSFVSEKGRELGLWWFSKAVSLLENMDVANGRKSQEVVLQAWLDEEGV